MLKMSTTSSGSLESVLFKTKGGGSISRAEYFGREGAYLLIWARWHSRSLAFKNLLWCRRRLAGSIVKKQDLKGGFFLPSPLGKLLALQFQHPQTAYLPFPHQYHLNLVCRELQGSLFLARSPPLLSKRK